MTNQPTFNIPKDFHEDDELKHLLTSEDVDKLRSVLHEGEVVLRLMKCFHQDSDGVLAATNQRIIFADQRFITSKVVEFRYPDVAALVYNPHIVTQTMTLAHSETPLTVMKVDKEQGERFIEFVEPLIGGNYTTSGSRGRVLRHNEDQLQIEDAPTLSEEIHKG